MKFRAKNQPKFKFTVTDCKGRIFPIYADYYAEMIKDSRVHSIKKTVRVRA